ncbi:MAG: hypothetical protein DI626_06520 [Micavibrio aeruginosavorus]|uniref:Uncharacterized protein n=1 Tax=Micavibrio aeruginosavorus TaxID=349221 RepID=A0A2W5BTE4_9BACT|nr:MAG: hypothetical protein DI626_06520 [Micavibrio aeruginosavorus]
MLKFLAQRYFMAVVHDIDVVLVLGILIGDIRHYKDVGIYVLMQEIALAAVSAILNVHHVNDRRVHIKIQRFTIQKVLRERDIAAVQNGHGGAYGIHIAIAELALFLQHTADYRNRLVCILFRRHFEITSF